MSVSSSSSSNASLQSSNLDSSASIDFILKCMNSSVGILHITAFTITISVFLLPLCILVLHLGLKRWRQRRSGTTMSHSDLITYNMVVTELISVIGFTLMCCGVHTGLLPVTTVGNCFFIINTFAQTLLHTLTCVERYLAVVHPVTYLSLRTAKGVRVRNIVMGCVWLLSFAGSGPMMTVDDNVVDIFAYCVLCFTVIATFFFSVSVLCILIRPGPGEGGRDRQRVDQSKLRAFYTIVAILGVLLLRFGGSIVVASLYTTPQLGEAGRCSVYFSFTWWSLPSCLVLPLLFLHRAGKLTCCKKNKTSGRDLA